jgi:hypothetical protein
MILLVLMVYHLTDIGMVIMIQMPQEFMLLVEEVGALG